MTSIAVRIQELEKSFGDTKALDRISLDVPENSIFGLLGPNGAGKTTLFSIIADFLKADSGNVEVLGIDVARISELQGRMTILPQDAQFQSNIPILEQLAFLRALDGSDPATARKEVEACLEVVGLKDQARKGVRTLSHGMIKRVGIAQAFLGNPEVILLDEPTSGLDPANARQIRDLVQKLKERTTIVISSHNLSEIQDICTHVAILDEGKLVTVGPIEELTGSGRELNLGFSQPLTEPQLQTLREVRAVGSILVDQAPDYMFTLDGGSDGANRDAAVAEVLRAVLDQGLIPRRLSEGKSLESHFLSVTGSGEIVDG